jgi:ubiquinone/menaquinone biosynthesis C-methylase UbiE
MLHQLPEHYMYHNSETTRKHSPANKGEKKMNEKNTPADTYALRRTQEETRRLQVQAQVLNPSTRRLFEQAGITTGMRVLDVGSGAGDVALLLADMVGPSGVVVGVEIDPTILDTARARVEAAGRTNVSFLVGEIESKQLDTEFDAIVGRIILMHLRSPASVLHRLAHHLRPGGIVAFQEFDFAHFDTTPAHPPNQLTNQVCTWFLEAVRRAGLPVRMGLDMYTVFLDAGFRAPQMGCEGTIGAGPDWLWYEWSAESLRAVLPLILKFGIATAEEVAIDTLAERLRAEAVSRRLVMRGPDLVSAWTRKASLASG